jgi:hypothetical protein
MKATTNLPRRRALHALASIALALGALATATVPARAALGNFQIWQCYLVFDDGSLTMGFPTPSAYANGHATHSGSALPLLGAQGMQGIAHQIALTTQADQTWLLSEKTQLGDNFITPASGREYWVIKKFKIRFVKGGDVSYGDIPKSAEMVFNAIATNSVSLSYLAGGYLSSGSHANFGLSKFIEGQWYSMSLFQFSHGVNSMSYGYGYGNTPNPSASSTSPNMRIPVNPVGFPGQNGYLVYETDPITMDAYQGSGGVVYYSNSPNGIGTGYEQGNMIAGLAALPDNRDPNAGLFYTPPGGGGGGTGETGGGGDCGGADQPACGEGGGGGGEGEGDGG